MKHRVKTRHLSIYLLKNAGGLPRTALKMPDSLQHYEVPRAVGFEGHLYVRPSNSNEPKWVRFVSDGFGSDIKGVYNASSSAVLFVHASGRWFALIFGYGRSLLHPDAYERDFGLKVCLNVVDPDKLRSVDVKTFEDLVVQRRTQTSAGSSLAAFGLDPMQDLLSAVTGVPRDESFAKRVAGSDTLVIVAKVEFNDIADTCVRALEVYTKEDYKERFGFVDHLHPVRDPQDIASLDQRLIASVNEGLSDVTLAAPEVVDWERVEGFTFSSRAQARAFPELELSNFFQERESRQRQDAMQPVTIEDLKRCHVGVRYAGAQQSEDRWSLYECLIWQTPVDSRVYILTAGKWFEVEQDFASRTAGKVGQLAKGAPVFPDAKPGEREGPYNLRVAQERGYAHFDSANKLIRVGNSRVEFCDLFTKGRQFVHVKRRTRSATLSHLFAQGAVSGETFLYDSGFRAAAKKLCSNPHSDLIPEAHPTAGDYQVVFAIITNRNGNWPASLPFFAQLNLTQAAERLQRFGYRVALSRVRELAEED